jgi:hypothetical protein
MGSEVKRPAPASPAAVIGAAEDANVQEQRCSRCREVFPVEDGELRHGPSEWWLCDPCHDKLIGPGSRSVR